MKFFNLVEILNKVGYLPKCCGVYNYVGKTISRTELNNDVMALDIGTRFFGSMLK